MTPEGKVKALVKALLKRYGAWYCMPMGQTYGRAGIPDFLICISGRFVGLETKSATGRQTATQSLEERRIREAGGEYLLIRPNDLDELERKLKEWTGTDTSS